jgi:hypothetical protein
MVRMILAFYDEEKETCAGWGGCGAEMWTSRQPPSSFKAEDVPKMALELSGPLVLLLFAGLGWVGTPSRLSLRAMVFRARAAPQGVACVHVDDVVAASRTGCRAISPPWDGVHGPAR